MGRQMKDSGVEWIGEIPEDWKVVQLGRIGKFSASGIDKKINENEVPVKIINYVDIYRNKEMKIDGSIDFMEVTTTPARRDAHLVEVGDVIFTPSSETIEEIGVSSVVYESVKNLSYSYHVLRFKPTIDLDLSFRKYMSNNHLLLNYFSKRAVGTIRKTLNRSDFKLAPVVLPTRKEQEKIANFLDQKTSHIDSIIEKTKASIEAFKRYKQALITETVTKGLNPDVPMKDSGIEEIGMIPEHWVPTMLKRFASIKYGLGQPPQLHEDGLPIIRATNIERGRILTKDLIRAKLEDIPTSKNVILNEGEILIVRSGAYAGDVARVSEEWDGALAGYDMVISLSEMDSRFITYALLSDYILKGQLYLSRMRSAQPHLNADDVGKILAVIPPLDEQHRVAVFLDEKTAHIDSLIQNKEAMIEKLEAYKKSLIYEYVTGKKEVE